MFTWLNKQGVKSSDGYILQSMNRFYYHYIEDDHIMKIITEGNEIEMIALSSFEKWQPPFEIEIFSNQKKEEIKKRVSDALDFMKIRHRFID